MCGQSSTHPQLLALLEAAKQRPEDDGARLVLADWLEDNGQPERAEFVRLQLRLAAGKITPAGRVKLEARCDRLLEHRGGCWLGPLWCWQALRLGWRRGLLSLQLPPRFDPEDLAEVLPWIDAALFAVAGLGSLRSAASVLAAVGPNYAYLDLRLALREEALLDELSRLPELPCLRALTFGWPLRMLLWPVGEGAPCVPAVSDDFLRRLLGCPFARRLTHLGSAFPFSEGQAEVVRRLGVEPFHARQADWPHDQPPSSFQRRGNNCGHDQTTNPENET